MMHIGTYCYLHRCKKILYTEQQLLKMDIPTLLSLEKQVDPRCRMFGASHHKYCLNPPADVQEVQQFEKKLHLTLPKEYFRFLTEVGNGGAGPDYGCYSLTDLKQNNEITLYPEAPQEILLDHTLTPKKWHDIVQALNTTKDEAYDMILRHIVAGGIAIGTAGCSVDYFLMCKGNENGNIVCFDWNISPNHPPTLTHMSFLTWFKKSCITTILGKSPVHYGL